MRRLLFLGALVYGLILLGLATLNGAVLLLAIPLVLFVGAGLLFGPREVRLEAKRSVFPDRAGVGAPVTIHLEVVNTGPSLEEVLVEDWLPPDLELLDGETAVRTALPAGARVSLQYTVRGRRGLYRFQQVKISACDRLGLFADTRLLAAAGQLFILPDVPLLKRVSIRPRQTRVYSGTIPARQGGPGVEFFGVRGYQPGDPLHHLNWRITARHSEALFTNEYEQERVADVGLILDARQRTGLYSPDRSLFEYEVTATAALAQALLNAGNRVGLLVYGAFLDWTYPAYGKIQRERILQSLARASVGASLVFDRLENIPTRVFPPQSQLILVSPLVNDDLPILVNLRARGYQVLVISPDPIAFEANAAASTSRSSEPGRRLARIERRLLIARLQGAGVQVHNWDVAVPFEQAMQATLARPLHLGMPARLRL